MFFYAEVQTWGPPLQMKAVTMMKNIGIEVAKIWRLLPIVNTDSFLWWGEEWLATPLSILNTKDLCADGGRGFLKPLPSAKIRNTFETH